MVGSSTTHSLRTSTWTVDSTGMYHGYRHPITKRAISGEGMNATENAGAYTQTARRMQVLLKDPRRYLKIQFPNSAFHAGLGEVCYCHHTSLLLSLPSQFNV